MRPRFGVPFAVLVGVFAIAAPARADEARDLFEEGTAAIHAGGYERAAALLQRSLDLRARPATAFNLVLAFELGGELRAAEGLCTRLRAGAYGELEEGKVERVTARCAGIGAAVPRIRVRPRVVGALAAPLRVEVDGRLVATLDGAEDIEVRVDPGEHVVRLTAPGAMGESATVQVEAADQRTLDLTVRGGVDEGATRRRRRRLGLGIGGGVAAAGILAIIVGVVLRPEPGPSNGDLGPAGT